MSHGYSQSLVQANKEVSARLLGVALGRHCIKQGISVSDTAERFGVSRMTVYMWFKGERNPNPAVATQIQRYIKKRRT
jgi:transcriptional regulator with XRE-family HTH domain